MGITYAFLQTQLYIFKHYVLVNISLKVSFQILLEMGGMVKFFNIFFKFDRKEFMTLDVSGINFKRLGINHQYIDFCCPGDFLFRSQHKISPESLYNKSILSFETAYKYELEFS